MRVLVEMKVPESQDTTTTLQTAAAWHTTGFELDVDYGAVPVPAPPETAAALEAAQEQLVVVCGMIDEGNIAALEAQDNVVHVWRDTPIAPMSEMGMGGV